MKKYICELHKAVLYGKEKGRITNRDYQFLYSVSKATSTRDLSEPEDKQLLLNKGTKGFSAFYVLYIDLHGDAIGGDLV
jgi:ATP-dependent DNA helicase RecG